MRNIQPVQYRWRKYLLWYDERQYEINEPDNWQDSDREIARSDQYYGMTITVGDDISFSGLGSELLQAWYAESGVIAKVRIEEYETNEITDEWELIFSGSLDFSHYKESGNVVTVKVNSEALQQRMTSRYETEINIDNDETLDGRVHGLGPLKTTQIDLFDRVLYGENTLSIGSRYQMPEAGGLNNNITILFSKNEEGYFSALPRVYRPSRESTTYLNTGQNQVFFNQQEKDVYVEVDLNIRLSFEIDASANNTGTVTGSIGQYDVIEDNDGNVTTPIVASHPIGTWSSIPVGQKVDHVFKYKGVILVRQRQQLVVQFNFGGWTVEPTIEKRAWVEEASMYMGGNTTYKDTKCQAYMPYDFFERMLYIMGARNLVSGYLKRLRLAILTGFMVRNVPGKEVSFSFQKLFQSYDSMEPLGLATKGDTVIIEKREYFFQDFLVYDFGDEVSDVSIEFDRPKCHSEIKVGFQTSNFTKENAVSEYSVRTIWTSPVDGYKQELNMVSNAQASSNTIETLRRVQYDPDTERTWTRRGDSTWFFIDLKDDQDKPRTWEDDFEEVPRALNRDGNYEDLKNAFSAYNLRLTPMNIIRNQGKWLNHGYTQFKDRSLSFSSSTGNTGMITKPIGEEALAENASLNIGDMGNPHYLSEKVSFIFEPFNFYKLITSFHDSGVQNFYGLFQLNYNGERIRGYLMNFKPDEFRVTLQIKDRTSFD
jgi:hypothetical protein